MQWRAMLALALLACWGPRPLAPLKGPTILVTNRGLGSLALYDHIGRLVTVMPFETRCVYLRDPGQPQALRYVIEGQDYSTPQFDPGSFEGGWRMEIGTAPWLQGLSLRPLKNPCHPAARQLVP